ncbi:MAG: DUF2442 domain-containing protein [Ignavibacteriae bacterium HGW-Ignavibacteriae-4]|nr:MAG: DUF2442 domain-containing protein [Ignavibacteriae bacterium HGW-Ignavibacteriae-4]
MLNKIIELRIKENYLVWLKFEDGFSTELDLKPFLGKGIAKNLLEREKFNTLDLDGSGGIAFYNGFDFCPNFLRMLANDKKETRNEVYS